MIPRRSFLSASTAMFAAGALGTSAAGARSGYPAPPVNAAGDPLNPPGIRASGIRMAPVCGGKYKVWTKQVGSGNVKVLLLHGGPGFSHDYLEVMESFLPQAGIEIFYYDQLGSNNSDQPTDLSLYNLPRFLEEVEEVRAGLGLEQFVLFGHSWGGMLAIEYALRSPQRLRGLVISNMVASIELYLKRTRHLRDTLLNEQQRASLAKIEATGDYENPTYEKIMTEALYPQMLCRIQPWPEPVTRTFRVANVNVYNHMQGKSEFEVTGNMKGWERMDRLHEIRTKTLILGAAHDEMDPDDLRAMAERMPNATCHICPNGSHLAMWDDQKEYFGALTPFLTSL